MFQFHRDEWLVHYHKRSRIESTFSSVKRVYGASVRAKKPDAMVNEVLLKCLAHNLSCLVHAIHELGVEPNLLGEPSVVQPEIVQ
ncbi:MAG: transposase [Polyangiaceae bacterium]